MSFQIYTNSSQYFQKVRDMEHWKFPVDHERACNKLDNFVGHDNYTDILYDYSNNIGQLEAVTISRNGKDVTFTYGSLWAKASRVANFLSKISEIGDRILLFIPTSEEFIEIFFGCILSGRIAVPLPLEKKNSRFSRANKVISDCNPTVMIFRRRIDYDQMRVNLKGFEHYKNINVVICEDILPSLIDDPLEPCFSAMPDQAAFIQYTSGSTASPKGVLITHKNLISNINMIVSGMLLSESDRVVSWLPLHHDLGLLGMLLAPVASRARPFIFPPEEFSKNPASWLATTSRVEGTLTGAPNFAFDLIVRRSNQLIQQQNLDLSKLRVLYSGSERISEQTIEKFFEMLNSVGLKTSSFFTCYGMAEAGVYVTGCFKDVSEGIVLASGRGEAYPSSGEIGEGLALRLTNDVGEDVAMGEIGQVEISGPSISPGYWNDIAQYMKDGIFFGNAPKWLQTGDLGYLVDRELVIAGRSKDIIKLNGKTIYPDDIETALEQGLPEWLSANSVVAFSRSSEKTGVEELVLVIEIDRHRRGGPFLELMSAIQEILLELNTSCARLAIASPLSLPKTSSGKKQRQRTAALLRTGDLKIIWDSWGSSTATMELPSVAVHEHRQAFVGMAVLKRYMTSLNIGLADERRSFPSDFLKVLGKHGFLSLLIPKRYGGSGLSHTEFAALGEELGSLDFSLAATIGIQNTIGILPILNSEILPDREAVLGSIARDGDIVVFALTEAGAGSNPRALRTTVRSDRGRLILSGEKVWIGNGSLASYVNVFAREIDENGYDIGISAFLVRTGTHLFDIEEEQLTVGVRSMPQNRIIFNETALEEADRLSRPGQGLPLAFQAMEYARFGLAGVAVGSLKCAASKTIDYAKSRKIATGNLIENRYFITTMSKVFIHIISIRNLVSSTSRKLDEGRELPQTVSLTCKIVAGEWAFAGIDQCLQFSGGRGYTETYGIGRLWRDIRIMRIFEGPTETVAAHLGYLVARRPKLVRETCDWLASDRTATSDDDEFFNAIEMSASGCSTSENRELYNVILGMLVAKFIAVSCYNIKCENIGEAADMSSILAEIKSGLLDELRNVITTPTLSLTNFLTLSSSIFHTGVVARERGFFDTWSGHFPIDRHPKNGADIIRTQASMEVLIGNNIDYANNSAEYQDVYREVKSWLLQQTKTPHIDTSKSVADVGVDSISGFEFLCFIEDRFKIKLSENIIVDNPTIDELCSKILAISHSV